MKPRPRRDYKEGQHRTNSVIRKKQAKELLEDEKKENLHEFGQRVSKLPPDGGFLDFLVDLRYKQAMNICLLCDKQLIKYEAKSGNVYLANSDKSPHRKKYKCVNSWDEYNGTN